MTLAAASNPNTPEGPMRSSEMTGDVSDVVACQDCGTPLDRLIVIPASDGLFQVTFFRCSHCRTTTVRRRRPRGPGCTKSSAYAE